MGNEDSQSSEISVLHGNDAFVNKLLSRRSSSGPSLKFDYYCKEPSVIPFVWEVQPGIPKGSSNIEGFVPPPMSPPPPPIKSPLPRAKPKHPSPTQPRYCFLNKPKKTRKLKKVVNESPKFGHSESSNSDNSDFFSSICALKSSSSTSARGLSPASTKPIALPSFKLRSLAQGLLGRLF